MGVVQQEVGEAMGNECPNCRDKQLELANVDGYPIEVDHCSACEGIWLDSGKLEKMLNAPAAVLSLPQGAVLGRRICPRCSKTMYSFYYPRTFVMVDMCKQCRGLWLDKNEFEEMDIVREFVANAGLTKSEVTEPLKRTVKEWLLQFIQVNINAFKFW